MTVTPMASDSETQMSTEATKSTETERLTSIKAQVYKDPRPKEHFDRYHARVRRGPPNFVYELTRAITSLYAWTFFRARSRDAWKVPASGAVILAPNHFSFMDHFFAGAAIRRRVQFMAK